MERNKKLSSDLMAIKDAHFGLFIKTRQKVFRELSDKQTIRCCCGRLATGFHERSCTKFNNKVDAETIKRLGHLLPKTENKHGKEEESNS